MKIVFCGGGTGGHITPALAMADILRQNEKNTEFAFIGRRGGKENEAVKKADIPLYELDVAGLRRSLSPSNIGALFRAARARTRAKEILRELAPDAVIGTGGYVSWPALSAARSLGIRCAIHESNAYPGLVTRALGRKCDLVMLGYPEAGEQLRRGCKIKVTGNPVRSRVGKVGRGYARSTLGIPRDAFVVLSFGGSLGAEALNAAMAQVIAQDDKRECLYIHATGIREYERYAKLTGGKCRILPYIEDMPTYLAAADVAVTRCGAMTLAEICTAGVPAILVPSPNVTANHQYKNARALSDSGGAVLIEEQELTGERLLGEIRRLHDERGVRERMRSRLIERGGRQAARLVLTAIRGLMDEEK